MLGAPRNPAFGLGVAGGVLLLAAKLLPIGLGLPLLAVTGLAGLSLLPRNRILFLVVATLIMLASFGLITHRDTFGVTWMLWLVLVVAVTDIAGYFAGRLIGGPKFWPRVSPKKDVVGNRGGLGRRRDRRLGLHGGDGHGPRAHRHIRGAQHGQPAGRYRESAIKRSAGVKDSSALLPGHGGVLGPVRRNAGRVAFAFLVIEKLLRGFLPSRPEPSRPEEGRHAVGFSVFGATGGPSGRTTLDRGIRARSGKL